MNSQCGSPRHRCYVISLPSMSGPCAANCQRCKRGWQNFGSWQAELLDFARFQPPYAVIDHHTIRSIAPRPQPQTTSPSSVLFLSQNGCQLLPDLRPACRLSPRQSPPIELPVQRPKLLSRRRRAGQWTSSGEQLIHVPMLTYISQYTVGHAYPRNPLRRQLPGHSWRQPQDCDCYSPYQRRQLRRVRLHQVRNPSRQSVHSHKTIQDPHILTQSKLQEVHGGG